LNFVNLDAQDFDLPGSHNLELLFLPCVTGLEKLARDRVAGRSAFPHSSVITQITLSSVKLYTS